MSLTLDQLVSLARTTPTPEELASVSRSSEIMAWLSSRAAKCDHLEARNKHLEEQNDSISARHGVLQAVIRKAREGLGNAMPECRAMSLPELVIEAASRINRLQADHKDAVELVEKLVHENRELRGPVPPIESGEVAVPWEVVEAAQRVKVWMETNGQREWQLCGICDRRLADMVEALRAENDKLRTMNATASRLASQEATAKHYAEEQLTHLAKFIGLPGMTWAHVVSEAVSTIEHANTVIARITARLNARTVERDALARDFRAVSDALMERTAERDALQSRVNRAEERANACGLQVMALTEELAEARAENKGLNDHIEQQHVAAWTRIQAILPRKPLESSSSLVEDVIDAIQELRAENGRQAATIAAMIKAAKVRIETPHTGRDDKALFQDWMESQPSDVTLAPVVIFKNRVFPLHPGETTEQAIDRVTKPLRIEVGKTYVQRNGGKDKIVADRGEGCTYRFRGSSSRTYNSQGCYSFFPDVEHSFDLVALAPAVDPASPQP